MTRDEANEIIAAREATERDALARKVAAAPSAPPLSAPAFAEGWELARAWLLDDLCTDA